MLPQSFLLILVPELNSPKFLGETVYHWSPFCTIVFFIHLFTLFTFFIHKDMVLLFFVFSLSPSLTRTYFKRIVMDHLHQIHLKAFLKGRPLA